MFAGSTSARLAAKLLEELKQEEKQSPPETRESLFDFLTRISPKYQRPEHFADILPFLEGVFTSPQRLLWSAPPRHGKTELLAHLMALFMLRNPKKNVAYISYAAKLSENKSRIVQAYFVAAGGEIATNSKAASEWHNKSGGMFTAVGIGGPIIGKGYDLIVVDDPLRNRADAESPVIRATAEEFASATAMSRLEPGSSMIVTHQRWHPDDLIGALQPKPGWTYVRHPAILDNGQPLWPSRWPLEALASIRTRSEYDWASMYMGEPRSKGNAVFNGTTFYENADQVYRYAIGLDLAYTAKTYADHSVCVTLGVDREGIVYVLDVARQQCEATKFAQTIRDVRERYKNPQMLWFVGGPEKGVAEMMRNTQRLPINAVATHSDKHARAQAVSSAWNAGKVRLPVEAPWLNAFVSEICSFTGAGDKHDDQVDALSAAFEQLIGRRVARGMGKHSLGLF